MDAFKNRWIPGPLREALTIFSNYFCFAEHDITNGNPIDKCVYLPLEVITAIYPFEKPIWRKWLLKNNVSEFSILQSKKDSLIDIEQAYKVILDLVLEHKVVSDVREYVLKPYL